MRRLQLLEVPGTGARRTGKVHKRHIRCNIPNNMSAGNADSVVQRRMASCLCAVAVPDVNTQEPNFRLCEPLPSYCAELHRVPGG